jgi:hypothetical protein
MFKKFYLKVFSYSLICIFIFACKRKIEYVYPVVVDNSQCIWLEDKDFVLDQRYLLNLYAGHDTLVVGGNQYLSLINKQGKVIDHYMILPEGHNLRSSPSLSSDLAAFLSSDNETVSLISVKNPAVRRTFKITDLDTSIATIETSEQWRRPFICINENIHKILFFYASHSKEFRYTLLDYSVSQDSIHLGAFNYFSPVDPTVGVIYNEYVYKENFMISFDYRGIYQIDKIGNLSASDFGNSVTSFFEIHDTLFACDGEGKYIYSTNNLNWNTLINNFNPGYGPFYSINNNPIYTQINQMAYLSIDKTKGIYQEKELCNDGLETARINDMVLFKDSVYIASTTGLYLKPLSRFLKFKN